ncbi:hypothetical protein [Cryobacterium sp. PH29-G1]|uniref:hypothetical protein n=1 Tax=Cryobacterium sp. PH29-G1 TaxID=3046211 RepID=UPI0024BA8084|nr:hypothetical protein [Cryobacterium sp. PH29-G1]MDJ0348412.1 hypothetical protein [Cryobacterium sp. PH29-G1]
MSPFISLLALAALLFAVFAMHSEVTGHAMPTPVPASATASDQSVDIVGMAAVMTDPVVTAMSAGGFNGMLDCALLAMTCLLLLILVAMVFLTRLPAIYRRLLDAGGVTLGLWRTSALPIHRPSLTLLSISRV